MRFKEFLFLFAKSLNPGDYKILVTRKKRDTIKYFLLLLFFSILIGFILTMPKLMHVPNKIETLMSKFEKINISMDVEANERIVLFEFPKVVLDFTGNETNESKISNEFILITKTDIFTKKFKLGFFKIFETESKPISEYSNLKNDFSNIKNGTYWLIFILLLPSAFLFVYLFNILKYVFIITFISLIGYIGIKIKRKKPSIFIVWRTAVFSSTIMMVLDIIVLPLFKFSIYLNLLAFLLYVMLFILALMVICEKDINLKQKNEDE